MCTTYVTLILLIFVSMPEMSVWLLGDKWNACRSLWNGHTRSGILELYFI